MCQVMHVCEGLGGVGSTLVFVWVCWVHGGQRSMYDVFLTLSLPYFPRQFLTESRASLATLAGWGTPETCLYWGLGGKWLQWAFM